MNMLDNYPPRTVYQQGSYSRQRAPGGVILLRLADARPETIDAWFTDCQRLMTQWRTGVPLRYLHDVRSVTIPTSYATDRVAQVLRQMRYTPVNDGRGAILTTNPILARLLESVIKRRPQANWHIRCFSDEAEALIWLRS